MKSDPFANVEKRFKKDLGVIVNDLIYFRPIAIILYGGYGRDEGSWVWDKNEKNCTPYNDYDIMMILESKISPNVIKTKRKELAKKIGIRWIDLDQKTISELKNLDLLIVNYDLKYASKVIYGDGKITDLIPEMSPENITLKDGNILFFTRMWTLLGSLNKEGLKVDREGEEARFFRNQMAKALLAIVDVLLIQKGQYDPSYKERVRRLKKYYHQKKKLIQLANWALIEKLNPKGPHMSSKEITSLYNDVYNQYFKVMYQMLTKYYKREIKNSIDIEISLKWSLVGLVKRIGWILIKWNFQMEKRILLNIGQLFILEAYNYGNVNNLYLKKGLQSLNKIDKTIPISLTWDEARCKAAQLRLTI
tara:strand:- start:1596 stop:2684 length:1089 start_codon:yes stop_codon:yes gene_type:complete